MFPLTQEYRDFLAFDAAYQAYQDEKVITSEEDAYWSDMEAMELHAEEDAYYRSFR
jgi:hypothetical protein